MSNQSDLFSVPVTVAGINVTYRMSNDDYYLWKMRQYPDFVASENIILYGYPWLILLGTLGNILTFAVMRTRLSSITSTYFYMTVLAAADITILLNGALRKWIFKVSNFDPINEHEVLCKLINFVHYWCFDFSAWILVAMTAERFIAVHWPLRCIDHTGKAKARKVIIGISIFLAIVNIPLLVVLTVREGRCVSEPEYRVFFKDVWPHIDATVYSFIPFTLLLLFNILIILELRKATAVQGDLQASIRHSNPSPHRRLTIMLLCISFAFLITSAPNVIYTIIRFKVYPHKLIWENLAKISLGNAISSFFIYTMHSINFFLYSISGQKFRQELIQMVCGWRCQNRMYSRDNNGHILYKFPNTVELTTRRTSITSNL